MKTKSLFTILLFAVFFFTSCQEEVLEIVQPNPEETLVATSELTNLISKTAIKDGSDDNILDKSSCTTIELPVTVSVNGLDIIVDAVEDYAVIEAIFDQFDDDDDYLNFIFPIKIILSDYTEIELNNQEELDALIEDCVGENEEDEDIECIDFKFPISFSAYDTDFQIIDVITIEDDKQLHKFIRRVKQGEVFASLDFPVEMILASGEVIEVANNKELQETIDAAKDACDEDDDNDYGDDDFTKERLDELLKSCPWIVYEFERESNTHDNRYIDYAIAFKEDNVVKVRTHEGELLSGTWESEMTDDGALVTLEFEGLEPFSLEWIVYELEPGKIKFFKEGGNRVILKKNCDTTVDFSPEMIENYLQECLWRITRLSVDGIDHEKDYIGTPLKFLDNNVVKIRIDGEYLEGTYEVVQKNIGNVLTIQLEGRPQLQIAWLVTFLRDGVMKLENQTSKMVMEWLCPNTDGDIMYVEEVLMDGAWQVAAYEANSNLTTESFFGYTLDFKENGKILITDPNFGTSRGAWLTYRNEGLNLGLNFGENEPFMELTHRWKIKEIDENRIELKDYNANGEIERILILEKKSDLEFTKEEIEGYLQECMWRVSRLSVENINHEENYIGTPLKFFGNGSVKIRINGEWIQGEYDLLEKNYGFILQIYFEDRPNLKLEWLITSIDDGVMTLENENNKFVMEWLCDGVEEVQEILIDGTWLVSEYDANSNLTTESFFGYTLDFKESGKIIITDPNLEQSRAAWLPYRNEGLNLGLKFGDEYPFAELTHRWKIKEIDENRIELKDYSANGEIERILMLEKKSELGFTKEEIEGYLQECMWRVSRLSVENINHEENYIGTPLKFFGNGSVKIRINGEWIQGEYDLLEKNYGFILQIYFEDRPNLKLEWLITSIEDGAMILENENNKFVMEWMCQGAEEVQEILIDGIWEVAGFESEIDPDLRTESFFGYTLDFYESGKILITDPNNGESRGSWLAYNKDGLNLGLRFGDVYPFAELTDRWKINEISENRIELKTYNDDGGIERILILEKKIDHGITTEEIEAYLQECHWRVTKLFVDEVFKEREYIGTPLKFMPNNGIMMRVKGEWIQGTYEVIEMPEGFYLQIFFDDRPNLKLWWKITFLEDGIIEMENENNEFIMEQHCQDSDEDLMYVLDVLVSFDWEVAAFESAEETDLTTDSFFGYTMNFIENGKVEVTNPNEVVSHVGSWLNYRRNGLYLGMLFGDELPFAELTHRWKIGEISPNRIELKDFAANGELERVIILEAKN